MCCLEIKKFGIICVTPRDEIESRDGCFSWKYDNDRLRDGITKTLEIIKPLKHLINFNVSVLRFSKEVPVIV